MDLSCSMSHRAQSASPRPDGTRGGRTRGEQNDQKKEALPKEIITSRTNPLCTHLRKLASSVSYRRGCGGFLCDSPKLLEEALLWRADLRTVVCTDPAALPALPDAVRCVQVPGDLMKSISPAQTPQGVLSVCGLPGRTGAQCP